MKVSIRDPETLKSLKPLEIISYLRSSGWKQGTDPSDKWAVWLQTKDGEEYELAIPKQSTLRDFSLRMGDALSVLEAVEKRSQMDIFRDLLVTSADVIRVRLQNHEMADGTLPIEDGAMFFQKAKDLMLAAACAAAEPRAYYPSKKPAQASDYLRRTRLGQTEHGSFVMTIISRVLPSLAPKNGDLFERDEPFERRVTQTLARSLTAVRKATEDAVSSGNVASFVDSVSQGVSANLCDAIAGMGWAAEMDRDLELDFSWSRSRPLGDNDFPMRSILFAADAFPVIKEAAQHLKESAPREGIEVEGPVFRLERADGQNIGKVTIHCFIEEQPRKVTVELGDTDYQIAVKAHGQGHMVRCNGTLTREGRAFRLNNPLDFKVSSDE